MSSYGYKVVGGGIASVNISDNKNGAFTANIGALIQKKRKYGPYEVTANSEQEVLVAAWAKFSEDNIDLEGTG
ncbi:hypothetical protein BVY04_00470 [bacterium M21]|nr:hypothetical protein BVY04_00470 [bacterium M21]